jgi:CHAD domain-containing protein
VTDGPSDPSAADAPTTPEIPAVAPRAASLTDGVTATLGALLAGPTDRAEAIHDFRVALRRLRSAQRPLGLLYGRGFARRTAEALRVFAVLTGDLRDEEVLRETLSDLSFGAHDAAVRAWMEGRGRRERGARGRVTALLRASRSDLERTLKELRARVDAPARRPTTDRHFVHAALARAIDKLKERAAHARAGDAEAMHKVRIAAKQLRYSAELTDGIAGVSAERITKLSARMQKHLGRLHDLDEALVRMGRAWGLDEGPREAVLIRLARERTQLADRIQKSLPSDVAALDAAVRAALER